MSCLDIKALIGNYIVCVNYGVVFILNDLLYLITGEEFKALMKPLILIQINKWRKREEKNWLKQGSLIQYIQKVFLKN